MHLLSRLRLMAKLVAWQHNKPQLAKGDFYESFVGMDREFRQEGCKAG
jgi:hypothetical protein